ncbi:MAG: hypothetical protein ACXIVQ_09225, partial [Acidimicrobiales bacterium]
MKLESDAQTREDKGRRVDAGHRRASQALLDWEEELVAGCAEMGHPALVSVAAPDLDQLDDDCDVLAHGRDLGHRSQRPVRRHRRSQGWFRAPRQAARHAHPLKATNALRNLGPIEAARCVASYAYARVRPPKNQDKFEGWVSARFGTRLYQHFFKSYTEKVWGIPADELEADWAAQRIKNLSLFTA